MYILLDFRPFTQEIPSNGDLFCEDFFHALFRNHAEDIFYLWTTGEDTLPKQFRFDDFSNVRRIHTGISAPKLYRLIRFLGYPHVDDLVETLAMKNGHLPWVGKFDIAFFSTPYPLLLEDDCFHVQFTSHLRALHYPDMYTDKSRQYHSKKWYTKNIEQADLNIVSSHFQKEEIKKLGAENDNILVCGMGDTEFWKPHTPQHATMQDHIKSHHSLADTQNEYAIDIYADSLPENFFFVRGNIHEVVSVIKSFELFRARFPESNMEMIIEEPFAQAFSDMSTAYKIRFISPASKEEKRILLSRCFAFIDPSLYSPEGKDIVRSMKCGARVIASGFGASSEILPENSLFFAVDEHSGNNSLIFSQIFTAMKTLFKDQNKKDTTELQNEKDEMITYAQSPQFSWDDISLRIISDIKSRMEKREFVE